MDARNYKKRADGCRENHDRMLLVFQTEDDDGLELSFNLPAKYEVCDLCQGRGTHVNPAIDEHGLSSEDFDDDPDFREEYFRGDYDVSCSCCAGRRVMLVVDRDTLETQAPDLLEKYDDHVEDVWASRAEADYQRRMGF